MIRTAMAAAFLALICLLGACLSVCQGEGADPQRRTVAGDRAVPTD